MTHCSAVPVAYIILLFLLKIAVIICLHSFFSCIKISDVLIHFFKLLHSVKWLLQRWNCNWNISYNFTTRFRKCLHFWCLTLYSDTSFFSNGTIISFNLADMVNNAFSKYIRLVIRYTLFLCFSGMSFVETIKLFFYKGEGAYGEKKWRI